ncbi:MAG: IS1595 family transposase [Bacteroidetes bacterium]|nr:IS1595 family transposase [Bacteroidota bacterium]
MKNFKNISDLLTTFSSEEVCRKHLEELRWNGVPVCPFCKSKKHYKFKDGKTYKCANKTCRKKYNATVGTIYENTKIPLQKWFIAMYLLSSHKKGISSLQLSRDLGITQKSAWFVLHRIRTMLKEKNPQAFQGTVEADETFVGGKIHNKHAWQRHEYRLKEAAGEPDNKTMVFGIVERNRGLVYLKTVNSRGHEDLIPIIRRRVEGNSVMVTDSLYAYKILQEHYKHFVVNHAQGEYVRGDAYTNTIEGFFSILKRGIIGIYHYASKKHLQKYCDEFSFRYNTRSLTEEDRFNFAMSKSNGRRLKYAELIAKK